MFQYHLQLWRAVWVVSLPTLAGILLQAADLPALVCVRYRDGALWQQSKCLAARRVVCALLVAARAHLIDIVATHVACLVWVGDVATPAHETQPFGGTFRQCTWRQSHHGDRNKDCKTELGCHSGNNKSILQWIEYQYCVLRWYVILKTKRFHTKNMYLCIYIIF